MRKQRKLFTFINHCFNYLCDTETNSCFPGLMNKSFQLKEIIKMQVLFSIEVWITLQIDSLFSLKDLLEDLIVQFN